MTTTDGDIRVLRFSAATGHGSCYCESCLASKAFELPTSVVDSFIKGQVILFVGAGVSTEGKGILPNTFYEKISASTGLRDPSRPFPDVMQDFCDGAEGRVGLVQEIKSHFDYIYAHEELYNDATRFHRELSTLFPVDTIVTTNWDTYFEDECMATAFVEDKDLALWDAAKRKVLKLHGTIANFGSLVATRSDYTKCAERLEKGILGGLLKSLLATRTTVFIGYSLKDDDFLQIYNAVRGSLAEFHRTSYFVAPFISSEDRIRLTEIGLRLVETDGQHFIAQMKAHAQSDSCIASDDIYERVANVLAEVIDAHEWLHDTFDMHKYPQILFCSWYQDGLIHSLKRVLRLRKLGAYSDLHKSLHAAHSYEHFAKRYRADRKFDDSAYCYGYSNGHALAHLTHNKPKAKPPMFFYFDCEIPTKSAYRKALTRLPSLHKSAYKFAKRTAAKYPRGSGVIIHHKDQLNLGDYI